MNTTKEEGKIWRVLDLLTMLTGDSTRHKLESGREADYFSGGTVYADCIAWDLFMVTKDDKRVADFLDGGGSLEKFAMGNGTMGRNSSSWDEFLDAANLYQGSSVGNANGWNSTFFL